LFGDGCGACLVSAEPTGLALGQFRAEVLPRSADLITWEIGDQGFEMHLSGQVPGRIRRWLCRRNDRGESTAIAGPGVGRCHIRGCGGRDSVQAPLCDGIGGVGWRIGRHVDGDD